MNGRIIIVNGTSSSGKSTLIQKFREAIEDPFCYYSVDFFCDGNFSPITTAPRDNSADEEIRRFMKGFHRSVISFAEAGNDVIVDHVLERQEFADDLAAVVSSFDVFWVGVTATLEELERRENARKNRAKGTAARYFHTNDFCKNDILVDTTNGTGTPVVDIVHAWQCRPRRLKT